MRYASKAEWAAAKARQMRQDASLLPVTSAMDWRGIKRRMAASGNLHAEAARFERMAQRFKAKGL